MKLLRLTNGYPEYLNRFYADHSHLLAASYKEQCQALYYDAFAWADFWSHALRPLGYEVEEIISNALPTQLAWWKEFHADARVPRNIDDIVIAQVKKFSPDILWFDHTSEPLLARIRAEVPQIKLVLGWIGSAIPAGAFWRHVDIVLSCAQETVDFLRAQGIQSEQLHHGFDPRILERLQPANLNIDFTFIGQIIRSKDFHEYRTQLLELLVEKMDLQIFSPSASTTWKQEWKIQMKALLYNTYHWGSELGLATFLEKLPGFAKVSQLKSKPTSLQNPKLSKALRAPVFGLSMYQTLRNSRVVLNIHADSSPQYASNMRLFETTGAGSCLLTDWRANIGELFDPERELLTYKSAEECLAKVKWLLDNPKQRADIALAGQKRTLADHTFAKRAIRLDSLIRKLL